MRKFEYPIKRMHIIVSKQDYEKLQKIADDRMTNVSNVVRDVIADFLALENAEQLNICGTAKYLRNG
jgi:predicted transcriptional regulator